MKKTFFLTALLLVITVCAGNNVQIISPTGFGSGDCPSPNYQGDGYCDDNNNIESCSYDNGDCCGGDNQYCTLCLCLETTQSPGNSTTGLETPPSHINSTTNYLDWYRYAHGAGALTRDLDNAAYEATNAVCNYGFGHHTGTEAEHSSLFVSSNECNGEASEIEALKMWYSECPDYYGQGYSWNTGHFTHLVWKSCTSYGIWAQTCNIPGSSMRCAVALKMDCSHNMQGAFSQNIGNVGQCANVDTPWAKSTQIKSIDTTCTRGEWCKTTMEQQENPEKLKAVALTVAGVILKQKMSDTNPLGRDCKLEFVFVENFKNQVVTTETHHIFDATFKWTQCGTLDDHRSTCKNMRVTQSVDMIYTSIHEDEVDCLL